MGTARGLRWLWHRVDSDTEELRRARAWRAARARLPNPPNMGTATPGWPTDSAGYERVPLSPFHGDSAGGFGSERAVLERNAVAEEIEMADVTSPLLGTRAVAMAGTPLATESSFIPLIGQIIGAGLLIASFTPRSLQRKMRDATERSMNKSHMPGSQVIPEIKTLFKWIYDKLRRKTKSSSTDPTSNDAHHRMFGSDEPKAHCLPGFPNAYTVASGTPLVTS